jgi:hypothetical protein
MTPRNAPAGSIIVNLWSGFATGNAPQASRFGQARPN